MTPTQQLQKLFRNAALVYRKNPDGSYQILKSRHTQTGRADADHMRKVLDDHEPEEVLMLPEESGQSSGSQCSGLLMIAAATIAALAFCLTRK